MNRAEALLLWALATAADAQADYPPIREIAFAGNDTTQPSVMLREMVIQVGDPADPKRIERSRQGIQDLGLFKSVRMRQWPVEGGVRLVFTVEEKWYILPFPRIGANSEGQNEYGLSVRWFNVWGLNHSLRAVWSNRDEGKSNMGRSERYGLGYSMPFVFDTPYGLSLSGDHQKTPINDFGGYTESLDSLGIGLSRTFGKEAASQGWRAGTSLSWSRQSTEGATAPPAYGAATTLSVNAGYSDVRFRIFSEDGVSYGGRVAGAEEGIGSDYSYNSASLHYSRYLALGETAHQNVNLLARAGTYHGGPVQFTTSQGAFDLGGTSTLRGYPGDFQQGDFFYYLGAEYLRPVFRDWARVLVVADAGRAFADAHHFDLNRVYASVGIGLRLRLTFLVNFEVEAGVAWPLDGGGARVFASKS